MKEVTWSSEGLVLFIVKKNTVRENLPGTALLWHSTPTREETEKEDRRENEIFSSPFCLSLFLRLLPFDKNERKR